MTRRFDLTDAQWATLEPLLPAPKRPGRPSLWSRRQLIDGIRWRIRVGARGGTCHPTTGPGQRCTPCSGAGSATETWQQVLTALQARADAAGQIIWDVSVDSTTARAHQHAAGARKRGLCRPNRPAGSASSRTTVPWVVLAAG
ncbi:transposase [Plantactinospora endophytica]|uniref:transposase n=1 Tax=Plantactinospora endophytica TaxID=673535 RepID=UPI003557348A